MLALYVKTKGMQRYLPFDYSNGTPTNRRIYMTMWEDEHRDHVQHLATEMQRLNPELEIQFEIRKVS